MAVPSTRQEFADYCLRRLGSPLIQINVTKEQVDDRIDDALAYYADYHFDGTEHIYLAYQMTEQDITNKYVTLDEDIIGVIRIFDPGKSTSIANIFNIRYQIRLNDLFDFAGTNSIVPYVMAMRHVEQLEEVFVGMKPIRFNRHNNKLHIDMDWRTDVLPGDYIVVDGYKKLDPETNPQVWSDWWLRRYTTALIKRQWGENLIKFVGMNLPGGVTFNGEKIYDEAKNEVEKLEQEMITSFSLPSMNMQN